MRSYPSQQLPFQDKQIGNRHLPSMHRRRWQRGMQRNSQTLHIRMQSLQRRKGRTRGKNHEKPLKPSRHHVEYWPYDRSSIVYKQDRQIQEVTNSLQEPTYKHIISWRTDGAPVLLTYWTLRTKSHNSRIKINQVQLIAPTKVGRPALNNKNSGSKKTELRQMNTHPSKVVTKTTKKQKHTRCACKRRFRVGHRRGASARGAPHDGHRATAVQSKERHLGPKSSIHNM